MLCLRSFPVATKYIDKWGGGGYQLFLMRFFRFTVPKNFIKKRFSASLNLGIEINRDKRGAGITIFRQIYFSHSGKKIRRGNLARFRKFLGVGGVS